MTDLSRESVEKAASRIRSHIHRTPVFTCQALNDIVGSELFFKCENFQKVGAFKARGALNAVLSMSDGISEVVTHSSGNHGAALAWAAGLRGMNCHVVVPKDASKFKRAAMVRYGANLVDCGSDLASRETKLAEFLERSHARFIPPYDDPYIIAGQGTATLELMEKVSDLDQIWVPVGGGGLASGAILASDGRVEIVGAEPELADDAYQSMKTGKRESPRDPITIADGLRSSLGDQTFEILHRACTTIALVAEAEIVGAMRMVWEHMKIVIEPSSAVTLAAILRYPDLVKKKVGIVLSGGNVSYASAN
ncbi:MAG: pyridoxal-phosphate dependent enzyme [Gammaproteobacteria bacterium]|nr:pyridoxal-phosphate dependent enzyme [Gammaproteobacteria bacterium]